MIAENMKVLVSGSSVIRAMFEEGKRLAALHGAENVYDFSLGNPFVEPPAEVGTIINDILQNESPNFVHGYMNNSGYEDVREKIAASLNAEFKTGYNEKNIIMTVGAAGALNIVFKTLLDPGDEVIVFAPFFGEYRNYVSNYGGKIVVVAADTKQFQINTEAFESAITPRTKAVIINSPNNPSGVIYSEGTLREVSEILEKKQREYNRTIYLISDEPYRKLVYGDAAVPYIPDFYRNTLVAYSFSKSLSLPGERIGYLTVPAEVDGFAEMTAALNVANRILGYVNAPSLFQRVAARCVDLKVDLSLYQRNRDFLYNLLTGLGFECIKPEGAFYIFPKALIPDDKAFCDEAKKHRLLIVPGSGFGCPGFFRAAYCVSHQTVEKSAGAFEALAKSLR